MIKDRSSWKVNSKTLRVPKVSESCLSFSQSPGRMVKQKELVNPSNTNCETWMKSATLKASWSLKQQSLSVVTQRTAIAICLVFLRVFGSSLRLPGSLLSDDPIDRQWLTADPHTDFQRTNDMRSAAQRALFKQNSARAVQAAGLARHRSQPRDDVGAGDTGMVWRNNKLTGRRGWTGPCCVANENITLYIHAWLVFERTSAQSDRRRS